jgi:hypothetical protein
MRDIINHFLNVLAVVLIICKWVLLIVSLLNFYDKDYDPAIYQLLMVILLEISVSVEEGDEE